MASKNQIADGFETLLETIHSELRFFSEPDEKAEGKVAAELFFRARERKTQGPSAMMEEVVSIELSVQENKPGWSQAVRRMRDYSDYQGSGQHTKSIEAMIETDKTLGGVVDYVIFKGQRDEERKEYKEGSRWTVLMEWKVTHRPAS